VATQANDDERCASVSREIRHRGTKRPGLDAKIPGVRLEHLAQLAAHATETCRLGNRLLAPCLSAKAHTADGRDSDSLEKDCLDWSTVTLGERRSDLKCRAGCSTAVECDDDRRHERLLYANARAEEWICLFVSVKTQRFFVSAIDSRHRPSGVCAI
jgi:hypothetical protein